MRILVTGATGFIGRRLIERLLGEGHQCRCLVRNLENVHLFGGGPDIEWFQGDVTRRQTLKGSGKGIDAVFHLAAAGHVEAVSEEARKAFFDLNVQGTRNITEECGKGGVKRFIHFSSTAAMGLIEMPVIDETVPCQPQTPYQRSKYESEMVALESGMKFGMDVVVLRPCMVYGPGCTKDFLKLCRLIKGGLFPRIGLGKNLTPMVHVNDVVQAAVKALDKGRGGEVYLIASKASPPLEDIHHFVTQALGIRRPYFYVPIWLAHFAAGILERIATKTGNTPVVSRKNILSTVTDRRFDISKAESELGYHAVTDLSDGIKETIDWFVENSLV